MLVHPPMSLRRSFFVALVLGPGLLVVACEGELIDTSTCKNIPAGGCAAKAGTDPCVDVACASVYTCKADHTWVFSRSCPVSEASVQDAGIRETSVRDVTGIDAPPGAGGGPGCAPLQLPDCALLDALICPSGCCECEDLFVCTSGSWVPWGSCQDGVVKPASR